MKKRKKETRKIVTLNNKSRKGKYIYAYKDGKGRYIRYKEAAKLARKAMKKAERTARRGITPRKAFKKGLTRARLDIHTAGNAETREAYIKLFKPLVRDAGLLRFLTENVDGNPGPLRTRFRHDIELTGETISTGTPTTKRWQVEWITIGEMLARFKTSMLAKEALISSDKLNQILDMLKVPKETRKGTGAVTEDYRIKTLTCITTFSEGDGE